MTISAYKDPASPTFGNLKRSMINAGYDEAYADKLVRSRKHWITENLKSDVERLKNSEKNFDSLLGVQIDWSKVKESDKAKLQLMASEFVLKTLGTSKYKPDIEKQAPSVQINVVNYSSTEPSNSDMPVIDAEEVKAEGEN